MNNSPNLTPNVFIKNANPVTQGASSEKHPGENTQIKRARANHLEKPSLFLPREKKRKTAPAHTLLHGPIPLWPWGGAVGVLPGSQIFPASFKAALAALLASSAGRRAQPRGSLQDGGAEEEPAAEREEPTRSPGRGLGAQGGPVGCRRCSLSAVGPPPSPWRGVAAGLSSPRPAPLTPEDGGACSRACALPPGRRGLGFAVQRPRASRARRGWGASWSRKGRWRAAAEMAAR